MLFTPFTGVVRVKKQSIENHITPGSGGNLTPFGKGGRSVDFEVLAAETVTFLVEMVVN